jgi:hypothetical protein
MEGKLAMALLWVSNDDEDSAPFVLACDGCDRCRGGECPCYCECHLISRELPRAANPQRCGAELILFRAANNNAG